METLQVHAGRAHAKLSASGSDRWLSCPGSVVLEDMFPEQGSTSYADEGTFAHELSELHLSLLLNVITVEAHATRLTTIKLNPFYSQGMEDHVQTYIDVVIERINAARALTPDAIVLLEQRLDFSPWVEGGYGTGDVVIIADRMLEIIDLKFGKGVEVSAIDNSQLRLYGLGAMNGFGFLYDIEAIQMTIIQPRLNNFSSEELSAETLLQWAQDVVVPGAIAALSGEGSIVPGDHCKFCSARIHCRARAMYSIELEDYQLRNAPLLSVEEIAHILSRAEALKAWASDITDYALKQAESQGVKFPGWKLVTGRSNRIYTNKEAIAQTLIIEGFTAQDIYEPQALLGITAMEKVIGKKQFESLLSEFIVKPTGKPVLVAESDVRPELSSMSAIDSEFADFDELEF